MVRKVRADQATAYGLHRRFPDCLLTSCRPHIVVASCRPLAGALNTASSVPRVIPSPRALGMRPPDPLVSPGTAFFVSGMYRGKGLAPEAIVERREAIPRLDGRIRHAGPARTAS